MKPTYNMSSNGILLSLYGKPPTASNKCFTTPHVVDLVAVLRERPSIKSGWTVLIGYRTVGDDFSDVDKNLQTFKDTQKK